MNILSKSGLAISASLIALNLASPVYAQVIQDEIIVTATKRAQTLQETPVTVSVTSADVLEKAQILDIQDLQSVVPSLRVGQLQTSANTNFSIRGFGNGANNAGIEPSVGVFIDGVYRSRSAAQIGDLPKLERIEVLSGPQSTLFGKNASAGVISVVTAKPSFEPQGYIEAGIGNYDQRTVRAYATGGISDTVAVSVGGSVNKRDGYAESAIAGLTAGGERDRMSIRGQLLFEPRDDISMRFIVDHSEIDEVCCHVTNFFNGPTAAAIQAIGGQLADPNDPFAYINYQNRDSLNKVNDNGFSAHLDIDFDKFSFTSITAYRTNDAESHYEGEFTTADLLTVNNETDIKTFTQEVRLTSTGDNKLDWMVGGYYFTEAIEMGGGLELGTDFRAYIDILSNGGLDGVEALFGRAPGTFFNASRSTSESFTQDDNAYSLFGNVDFHVNDKLTLTAGLNFTNDKKKVTGSQSSDLDYSTIDLNTDLTVYGVTLPTVLFGNAFRANTTAFAAGGLAPTPANIALVESLAPGTTAALNAGVAQGITGLQSLQFMKQFLAFGNSVEDSASDDEKLTWNLRAAYEVNSNINVYASAATGFKSTSWNLSRDSRPFATDQTALEAAGLAQPNQQYGTRYAGPEEATVYEIGIKARFNRGAFNLAIFDQSIEGFQSNTFNGTGFVLANAGKQATFGAEFDASYYPLDALKLTLSGIYLDAKYDSFVGAPGPDSTVVDLSGEAVAGIPEWGFSTSATYTHDFGSGTTGYIRADYQYESTNSMVERIYSAVANPETKANYFNGSIGVNLDNGFAVQVWGRNIFNHEAFIRAFPGTLQAGTINAYPVAPATYGLKVRKNF